MADATDSVIIRYLLTGDGVVATKIRAMRAEILGLDKTVQKANATQVESAVASSKAATALVRFGSAAKWTAGIFGIGLAFGLVGTLHRAADFMSQQTVVMKQTEAQLISTGRAAGFTGDQLQEMANKRAAQTGQNPLDIQAAENQLLAFTNVRGAIFAKTVKDANDLGVGLKIGPLAAAKALGFALDYPAQGMMRLNRLGVDMSVANKAYIKDLVKRGETEQAQLFILGKVEMKYHDSARLYGQTLPGELGKLNYAIDELLSKGLHPMLIGATAVVAVLAEAALWLTRNTWVLQPLMPLVIGIGVALGVWVAWEGALLVKTIALFFWHQLERLQLIVQTALTWAQVAATIAWEIITSLMTFTMMGLVGAVLLLNAAFIASPIGWIVLGVAALAIGIYLLYTRVGWFHHAVIVAWQWLKANWPMLAAIILFPFIGPLSLIIAKWQDVLSFIERFGGAAKTAGAHMWDWLVTSFEKVVNTIVDMWNGTLGHINLGFIGGPDLQLHHVGGKAHAAAAATPRASATSSTRVSKPLSGLAGGRDPALLHPKEIHTHVNLDGKEIATAVNEYNATTGARR